MIDRHPIGSRRSGGDHTTIRRKQRRRGEERGQALVVLFSPDPDAEGRTVPLAPDAPPVTLGRRPPAGGAAFADGLASREHAAVSWDAARGAWIVADLDSSNGTSVNGRPIREERLVEGDILRLGDTFLRFASFDLAAAGWATPAGSAFRGRSPALRRIHDDLRRVAGEDVSVLVLGETGTGKDLVARELHRLSGRRGPFRAINCAAIPRDLAESELFGHRRGAFSGAVDDRPGHLRAAAGGTVLLDEIGELAPAVQAKLLRVLEERRVHPLGAGRDEPLDVRFVFATNRDLHADAAGGRFRADLLARLAQWTVTVPPLRERPEDIAPVLAACLAALDGDRRWSVSGDAFECLALHPWPLNVRGLVNAVREAAIRLPRGGVIEPEHLPPSVRDAVRSRAEADAAAAADDDAPPLPPEGEEPSARELERLLAHYDGNVAEVARHTARGRTQVYRWLDRAGLDPTRYRARGRDD